MNALVEWTTELNTSQTFLNGSKNKKFAEVSLSIGIRPDCNLDTPLEQLIHEANQTMYAAKRNGKAQAKIWGKD